MVRFARTLSTAVLLGSIGAVLGIAAPALSAPLVVFVSVPPQASLVRDIGGPHVLVHCLVQAGQDPHVFEPTPKQMLALAHAKVFFAVGIPFERPLLEKIRGHLPDLEIVDSSRGFTRRPAGDEDDEHVDAPASSDSHGETDGAGDRAAPGHAHGHGDLESDPHIWLSPEGLRIMAKNMADVLGRVNPAHAAAFQRRMRTVHDSIGKVDGRVRAKLAPYRGRTVYVFHPAFGYFCDAYGLKQKAVEVDDKPQLAATPRVDPPARRDGARAILTQGQFDPHGARVVAEAIGGRVAVVDPLAEDVVANFERIADAMVSGMDKK